MPTSPPLSSSPLAFHFPGHERFDLADRTPVYHVFRKGADLTTIALHLHRGSAHDPMMPGSTAMAMEMLMRGTERRAMQEFAEAVERLGGTIRTTTNRSSSSIVAVGLTEHAAALLELLSEALTAPRFDPVELEAARALWISETRMDASEPMWLASRALSKISFASHPYERPHRGTVSTLGSLTMDAVRTAYGVLRHAPRTIIIAGGASRAELEPALHRITQQLEPVQAVPAIEIPVVPVQHAGVAALDDAVQTALAISLPGPTYHNPDFPAVRLIATVLGGYTLSRLFTVLREEKGYTYGAYAGVDVVDQWGTIDISTSVGSEATADTLTTIRTILDQVASAPLAEHEVNDARQHLLGTYARAIETPQQVASALWRLILHQLPLDHYTTTVEKLQQVQSEELRTAQATWFDADRWLIGASGDPALIETTLRGVAIAGECIHHFTSKELEE